MKKKEVLAELARRSGVTQAQAQEIFDALFHPKEGLIAQALAKEGKFSVLGFGTFYVRTTKEREGRVPSTGEKIVIGPKKVVRFKPGKTLKEALE